MDAETNVSCVLLRSLTILYTGHEGAEKASIVIYVDGLYCVLILWKLSAGDE